MGHVTARQLQFMSKQNGGCSEEKESENAEAKSYFYFNLLEEQVLGVITLPPKMLFQKNGKRTFA